MKKDNKIFDVVFIIDKSGSMLGTEDDTIGGYNKYINDLKSKNARITTVLFNDKHEMITKRQEVSKVPLLTRKKYFVGGWTALLDAIGSTIKYIDRQKTEKVMFIITTDGYENSSRKFSKSKIKKMIKSHGNWEFIYIGADIDSYVEGMSIGIMESNITSYKKDRKGISKMFNILNNATDFYYEESYLNPSWKEKLEDYMNENNS